MRSQLSRLGEAQPGTAKEPLALRRPDLASAGCNRRVVRRLWSPSQTTAAWKAAIIGLGSLPGGDRLLYLIRSVDPALIGPVGTDSSIVQSNFSVSLTGSIVMGLAGSRKVQLTWIDRRG